MRNLFLNTHRRVFAIALPMTAASLGVPLLGIVDTAILGHLEHLKFLAAVAAGSTAMMAIYWLLAFLRMGNTGLTAQAWGREAWQDCREYLFQSLVLALILSLGLLLLNGPIITTIIGLINPSPEVTELAIEYGRIRLFSAPATLCTYAILGWLMGLQRAKASLAILLFINVTNIVLDFVFILGLGLNSRGAALASFTAEWLGLALAILLARKQLTRLPGNFTLLKLTELARYQAFFRVNRHLFVRTAFLLFTMSFFAAQGARLGDDILAANSILMQLLLTVAFTQDGFAHAAETLTGHAIGSRNRREFYGVCALVVMWSSVIAVVATLFFWLWPNLIISFFTDLTPVFNNALLYWPWLVALPLAGLLCFVADGIFIGTNKTAAMQNVMIIATTGFFVPCWYFSRSWENHGLWLSYLVFLVVRSTLMTAVFVYIDRTKGWLKEKVTWDPAT